MLDTNDTLAHLAADIAERRARLKYVLDELDDTQRQLHQAQHDLSAFVTENEYLREVVGRLSGTDPPEPGEVHPYHGKWKRTDEENELADKHYTNGTIWHDDDEYHPPVEGVARN